MKKLYLSPRAQVEILNISDETNGSASSVQQGDFDLENKDSYERIPLLFPRK